MYNSSRTDKFKWPFFAALDISVWHKKHRFMKVRDFNE